MTHAPQGDRLLAGFFVTGALGLAVLAAQTAEAPHVPPLANLAATTVVAPELSESCLTSGEYAKTTTCYWTLAMEDGQHLAWPWGHEPGELKQAERYLRKAAPLTVRFWRGTAYQIEVADGGVSVDYDEAASWDIWVQRFWLAAGVVVAAAGLTRIGIEVWRVRSGCVDDRPCLALTLNMVCLVGIPALAFLAGRRWWAVIALAFFAMASESLTRTAHRLESGAHNG